MAVLRFVFFAASFVAFVFTHIQDQKILDQALRKRHNQVEEIVDQALNQQPPNWIRWFPLGLIVF